MKHTIDTPTVDRLADEIDGLSGECEPYVDYSGRGMFGQTCLGFVLSGQLGVVGYVAGILESQGILDCEIAQELALNYRTDNMGYSTIVYWPTICVVD